MKRTRNDSVGFITLIRWVLALVKPYRTIAITILVAMALEVLASLALPWPLKIIIDNVIGNKSLPAWLEPLGAYTDQVSKMKLAGWAAIAMIALTALGGLAGYINAYLTETISQHIAFDLRKKIYHHLQKLSFSFYDNNQVGKLVSTLTTDVNTIQDFATTSLLNICIDLFTILGMTTIMFSMNWDFSLITVAIIPFIFFAVVRFRRMVKMITHEVRKDQSEMMAILHQGLENIRAVNAFGRQDFEEKKLDQVGNRIIDHALHARRMKSLISPVTTLVIAACTAYVLWRGTALVLSEVMTLGALTVFITYIGKFFAPVKELAKMTGGIVQATVAAERINHLMNSRDLIQDHKHAKELVKTQGRIRFDHVSFAYRKGVNVLHDISFEIQPGEHIGICGPTGSGKSTLASLIPRFYEPTEGNIYLDGTNVNEYLLTSLRMQIGYVLQDTMLFYGTIRENIAYGNPAASEVEIFDAAVKAKADEFIRKLPKGYDTIIGERGLTLSNGQRQRIGIARAVLRNSPILILDEPTASLDLEAQKQVTRILEEFMKGRTVITITHRLSTIEKANKILVIDQGKIVETGTHAELLKLKGLYSRLYSTQVGPENISPQQMQEFTHYKI